LFPLRTIDDDDEREHDIQPAAAGVAAAAAPAPAALVLLEGGQMGWRNQCVAAVAHSIRLARHRSRELAEREGGMVSGLLSSPPPSVADQNAYAKSRAWVPPGQDGGLAEGMGVIYHALVGRPGVAVGNAFSATHARPLRWCIALGVTLALAIIVLVLTGHVLAAVLAGVAAAVLALAWAGAGFLLMRVLSARPSSDNGTEDS